MPLTYGDFLHENGRSYPIAKHITWADRLSVNSRYYTTLFRGGSAFIIYSHPQGLISQQERAI